MPKVGGRLRKVAPAVSIGENILTNKTELTRREIIFFFSLYQGLIQLHKSFVRFIDNYIFYDAFLFRTIVLYFARRRSEVTKVCKNIRRRHGFFDSLAFLIKAE